MRRPFGMLSADRGLEQQPPALAYRPIGSPWRCWRANIIRSILFARQHLHGDPIGLYASARGCLGRMVSSALHTTNDASSPHHPILEHHRQCLIASSSLRLIDSSSLTSPHRLSFAFASSRCRRPSAMPHRLRARAALRNWQLTVADAHLRCDGRRGRCSRRPAARCLLFAAP